jgi:hypothetical protein
MLRLAMVLALTVAPEACANHPQGRAMTMNIQLRSSGEWTVHVTRAFGEQSREGVAVGRGGARSDVEHGPAVALAGSRAFLALGNASLEKERFDDAIACARAGLKELGNDYAPGDAVDDTTLKLAAAEESIQNGQTPGGARTMMRTLEVRTRLYVKRHADQIVE